MTVASGATLAGTGTVTKDTTINGTLAPGNSGIGTIHLIGNQTFTSGSALPTLLQRLVLAFLGNPKAASIPKLRGVLDEKPERKRV